MLGAGGLTVPRCKYLLRRLDFIHTSARIGVIKFHREASSILEEKAGDRMNALVKEANCRCKSFVCADCQLGSSVCRCNLFVCADCGKELELRRALR
mmetsp:Transcript_9922/g.11487  ORF Transcript_9922/g.11487 Transcript_9922/m.11487 type:complete len:97 (-) Transcript_9922:193-483(-)